MSLARWAIAFAFTQAVEIPIYRRATKASFAEAFAASAITHPFVWFLFPWAWSKLYLALFAPHPALWLGRTSRYLVYLFLAEAFAVLVEAAQWRWRGRRRPLWVSLVANAASVALGLTLRALVGLP